MRVQLVAPSSNLSVNTDQCKLRYVPLALAAFFAQLAVIYVPVLQWIFRTERLPLDEWLWILPVTGMVFLADEAYKVESRKRSA